MPPQLPESLHAWSRGIVGECPSVIFCGWDHADSRVWRLTGDRGVFYLKNHRQPRKFIQERDAYREWCIQLPGVTPHCLGVCDNTDGRALLFDALPGILAESDGFSDEERLEIHRQAGQILRSLHALPIHDHDRLAPADALRERAKASLDRAGTVLSKEWQERIRADLEIAADLMQHTRVPCHRDYTARNWMVERSSSGHRVTVRIFDFEHARADIREMDFQKTYALTRGGGACFFGALLDGYGLDARERTAVEEFLHRVHGLYGLVTVLWSRDHRDPVFEQHGMAALRQAYPGLMLPPAS